MALEVINIKQPYDVSLSGNPIHFVYAISPYGDAERNQTTQLLINVFVEIIPYSGSYIKVKSQAFYPSTDGLIEFDLRAYIDPYLFFAKVPANLANAITCDSHRCRFKISYQLLQNSAVVTNLTESAILVAIKGGLPYEQWHPSEFFSDVIANQKKALNYESDSELVGKNDSRFLYWMYPFDDAADQTVSVTVYFEDGTTNSFTYTTTVSTLQWGVCCMPVGYGRMDLESLANGKNIVYYAYTVINAATIVIVSKSYKLDYRTFYRSELLLYRNSLGALETIRLRGQIDFEADYVRQNAMRLTPPSYFLDGILNNQNSNYFSEETEKKIGDTGFLSKPAQQKIRALFLAEEIYELLGDKLLPVSVSSANAKYYSNRDSLIAIQIEWKKAYANQFYLPSGVMPLTRSCPGLLSFVVRQTNRTTLRIMWSIPVPYDKIDIIITLPNGTGGSTDYEYTYLGNSGVVNQYFHNPNTTVGTTIDVPVKARVICNQFTDPMDMGAQSTVTVAVNGPSFPIARTDFYRITSGYGTAVTLSPTVLANDEDPDGDAIEVAPNSGSSAFGGSYTIDAAGIIVYTPPTSAWVGQDSFQYILRKVANPALYDFAQVYVNSVNNIIPVFAKLFITGSGGSTQVYVKFFSNSGGTVAIDVTGFGLIINYTKIRRFYGSHGGLNNTFTDLLTVAPTSSQVLIFTGLGAPNNTFTINTGTGYTP